MPVTDRPRGDNNSESESTGLNDVEKTRFVSIPIGSDPDTDEDADEDDPAAPRDQVVERWLNGPARMRS